MRTLLSMTLAAVLLANCAPNERADAPAASSDTAPSRTSIEGMPSPAAPGAAEPFLATLKDGVGLTWLEPVAETDKVALRFARFDGRGWSAPRTIVERNDLFVNWADFPSFVEDRNGILFAHWLQKSGPGTYAYDVRMSISRDGGATWGEPFLLHRDGTQTEHGFASLAALPAGGIAAAWLDGRHMHAGGGDHAGHDGGDMTLRYATVDAAGTITSEAEVDRRTCECCATGMAMTADGPVIVYRDRSPEEVRDIAFVRLDSGSWSEPALVRSDGWTINGCPVNGPQIDADGQRAAAAWFTAAEGKARVYAAFSDDSGRSFGEAITVDDGMPVGRVDIVMLEDGSAVVSWLEQTEKGADIRARRVGRSGAPAPSVNVAAGSTARSAGFTRITRRDDEVWFAWTDSSEESKSIRLARLRF